MNIKKIKNLGFFEIFKHSSTYFSGTLIHFIIPAHPVHAVFQLLHAGIGPLFHGHIGFEKIQIGKIGIDTHSHAHYLHHKYFECNYADGAIPLDKIFGTFHI